MEKQEILTRISNIEKALNNLIREHQEVKNRLAEALNENSRLNALIEKQNEEIKNFQNQDKITKIVSSITEDTRQASELKLKINEYIREIDKCIAHLSE
ncbi:MAG: hypothetical protein ACK40G_08970 [Cytophagaceae bacterium]